LIYGGILNGATHVAPVSIDGLIAEIENFGMGEQPPIHGGTLWTFLGSYLRSKKRSPTRRPSRSRIGVACALLQQWAWSWNESRVRSVEPYLRHFGLSEHVADFQVAIRSGCRKGIKETRNTTSAAMLAALVANHLVNNPVWESFISFCYYRIAKDHAPKEAIMAIEDSVLVLEPWGGADGIFRETGAIAQCSVHPEIFIRIGDAEKEKRAFELADARLRDLGRPDDERQAAKDSMAASLGTMADRRCPRCAANTGMWQALKDFWNTTAELRTAKGIKARLKAIHRWPVIWRRLVVVFVAIKLCNVGYLAVRGFQTVVLERQRQAAAAVAMAGIVVVKAADLPDDGSVPDWASLGYANTVGMTANERAQRIARYCKWQGPQEMNDVEMFLSTTEEFRTLSRFKCWK
jgi:hypothetical protein